MKDFEMEPKSGVGKPHARRARLALGTLASVLVLGAFTLVDVSGEAEPSWMETRLTSALLRMKIRSNRPMKLSPLTPSEADPERASELYEQQCAFCHGAGRGRMAPFAKSLSPRPPQFVIQAAQGPTWMDAYIIRHGIRWTGMPAFRGLSEGDAWRMALYVEGQTNPEGKQ
jgi:mono/diheme cytochrome c family protein